MSPGGSPEEREGDRMARVRSRINTFIDLNSLSYVGMFVVSPITIVTSKMSDHGS